MPLAKQRAFFTRAKRQNREDGCRCYSQPVKGRDAHDIFNSRDSNPYDAPQGDDSSRPFFDFKRTFAPSTSFTSDVDDARRRRDFITSDFPPFARRTSRDNSSFTNASSQWQASAPRRRFNPFPGYAPPPPSPPSAGVPYRATTTPLLERDPASNFNPLARLQKGGPMRGTGTFARALQMKSPISWIRNWQTGSSRPRVQSMNIGRASALFNY
ncbi:hypothetical protein PRIPAC_97909 [Pristionchus pacificus]|uniref:Uncharacterized protein n=1 Tax=Pristionchus pacificus TaxID=54126 RepID=A0A454XQ80_PRIPA|nr:hypothetical protein PRIPAC_97909 [Pristionchus pacificus]|eukprot:PDM84816.1 hypothetical protein PRIPAC_33839 [Pristionchus pacificus]